MPKPNRDSSLTLPERVAWAMQHAGVETQADLARAVEVSRGTVQQWCNGDTEFIRPMHLFRAARALRVEPEWLGTGEGPRTRLERQASDVDAEICRLVSALPEGARAPLLSLLVAFMRR